MARKIENLSRIGNRDDRIIYIYVSLTLYSVISYKLNSIESSYKSRDAIVSSPAMISMKKKIYINGRFLTQRMTGVQRYALEMVKAIDRIVGREGTGYVFEILLPHNKAIKTEIALKNITRKTVGVLQGHMWEQIELPYHCGKSVLINLCNTGPLAKKNQSVTFHDASVFVMPQDYILPFRLWYKHLFRSLGKSAQAIATVSSFSRSEIAAYCDMDEQSITVLHNGREHLEEVKDDASILERFNLHDKTLILIVSTRKKSKNLQGIIKTIEILDGKGATFVSAGYAEARIYAANENASSPISYLGYLTDMELKALYKKALCLFYPSLYEGFGLPPLEAMSCGCPVVASNIAPIMEVCGEAALYCDPRSPADMAEKIGEILTNKALREEMAKKGLERARLFSWDGSARKLLESLKSITGA
jgi:glycosyltransferase involved in cell wall biosynthesis